MSMMAQFTILLRQGYGGTSVICRGNNGQSIFEPVRSDGFSSAPGAVVKKGSGQCLFLSTLEEVCQQTGWRIDAYVLMGNHDHFQSLENRAVLIWQADCSDLNKRPWSRRKNAKVALLRLWGERFSSGSDPR